MKTLYTRARVALFAIAALPMMVLAGSSTVGTDLLKIVKSVPAEASLGQPYTVTITATAMKDVSNVAVTDEVPGGASFVSSTPKATANGRQLIWRFDTMAAGESKTISVTLKAEKEGDLSSCTTFSALPRCCVATFVGRPQLAITKTGPETALIGDVVTYQITVTNPGTAVARDVVVTDNVPNGLAHTSGQSTLTFNVGDLAPKASKTIPVVLTAKARGKVCNKAMANASNTDAVDATACTVIQQRALEITKAGPKSQFLGKTASYQIVVKNPGDTLLTNVAVTDVAPAGTRIVSADGASVEGNTAVWILDSLAAGGSKKLSVTLTSREAGERCNSVSVRTREGLSDSAQACTLWKGYPAVLIEVIDTVDPLLVDEKTQYRIRVTNQGTAPDTNVEITAQFPEQVVPMTAGGATAGTVNGQVVRFAPYASLAAKQAIEFTIDAKAAKVGDSRLKVKLKSDLLTTPVTEEESTHVY